MSIASNEGSESEELRVLAALIVVVLGNLRRTKQVRSCPKLVSASQSCDSSTSEPDAPTCVTTAQGLLAEGDGRFAWCWGSGLDQVY